MLCTMVMVERNAVYGEDIENVLTNRMIKKVVEAEKP
jgi:hypothetical protein